jgi:hypothetical protein
MSQLERPRGPAGKEVHLGDRVSIRSESERVVGRRRNCRTKLDQVVAMNLLLTSVLPFVQIAIARGRRYGRARHSSARLLPPSLK